MLLRVSLHGIGVSDTAALAKILRPIPNQFSPHRNIDAEFSHPLGKRCWHLPGYLRKVLSRRPAKQTLVVRPSEIQEPFVTTAISVGMDLHIF